MTAKLGKTKRLINIVCQNLHQKVKESQSEKKVLAFISCLKRAMVGNMVKKAVIVISLIEKSVDWANREIEKEILDVLSEEPPRIPWLKEVEKVTVADE